MALSQTVQKKIEEWTRPPYDEKCISEIKSLISEKNDKD